MRDFWKNVNYSEITGWGMASIFGKGAVEVHPEEEEDLRRESCRLLNLKARLPLTASRAS
jgi:hypothetical protein